MSQRKKTILIIAIVIFLIVIAVAIYLIFFRKPETPVVTTPPAPTATEQPEEPQIIASKPESKATPEEAERGQVKNLANSFAERFGSFSNQSGYQNLIELKALMTEKMQASTDNFIATSKNNQPATTNYYALTAKALTTQEINYNAASGQAEYLIKCQRQETVAAAAPRVYYQDLKISLIKQDSEWLIDSAVWQ